MKVKLSTIVEVLKCPGNSEFIQITLTCGVTLLVKNCCLSIASDLTEPELWIEY